MPCPSLRMAGRERRPTELCRRQPSEHSGPVRSATLCRLERVEYRRQLFILYIDEKECFLGRLGVLGGYRGDLLPHEQYPVPCQHRKVAQSPSNPPIRQVVPSEDGTHPGDSSRPDINNPESSGVSPRAENNVDGVRLSTALTYINPNRHRLNLTLKPSALVTRIQLDGNRATGVQVESGGQRFTAEGNEIVLSAGAVGSPQVLMLSGIGPSEHLRSLGIPVVHGLPGVGQNLRDHSGVGIRLRAKPGLPMDLGAPRLQVCLRYTAEGSSTRNDMMILPFSLSTNVQEGGDPTDVEGIRIKSYLYLALGAGELCLTSTDPHVQPHLDFRYLEHPWDRQRLRESVRLTMRLLEYYGLQDIVAERITPTDQDLMSEEALDIWLLKSASTTHHISGTCKMGPASDPMAVVDQSCRVHGLDNLRVVDASVMPDCVRANTNATVLMIGERAADFIKARI